MSASGKSSNRLYEYNRGYFTGDGHGIYADQGKRDRKLDESTQKRHVSHYATRRYEEGK